jgi:hypothetical protein
MVSATSNLKPLECRTADIRNFGSLTTFGNLLNLSNDVIKYRLQVKCKSICIFFSNGLHDYNSVLRIYLVGVVEGVVEGVVDGVVDGVVSDVNDLVDVLKVLKL